MAETQREHVPLNDAGELDTALAFLRFARHCVVKKTDGLDDEQLRRVIVPTGTSLLGLVQHLAVSERYWFGHHLAGSHGDTEWSFTMRVPPGRTTQEVLHDYVAAARESDETIAAVGDPDALTVHPVHDERLTLRWVLAHMAGETARHAGHADILREQIDGATGADRDALIVNLNHHTIGLMLRAQRPPNHGMPAGHRTVPRHRARLPARRPHRWRPPRP